MRKNNFRLFFVIVLQLFFISVFGMNTTQDTVINRLQRAQEINKLGGLKLMQSALKYAQNKKDTYSQWLTLDVIGTYYLESNQMDEALSSFQNSLTLAIELDSTRLIGIGYLHLSNLYMRIGRLEKGKENGIKALDIFKETGDKYNEANSLGALGNVYTQLGISKKGLESYQKAYQLFEKLGNTDKKSGMNLNIGYFYLMNGQGEAAIPYVINGLEYDLAKGNTSSIAMGYGNLAYAYSLVGDYKQAFLNYQNCVDTAQKYGYTRIEYDTYKDMSETYTKSGNAVKAMEYLSKYYTLKDSIIGQKTQNRVSELEIQFETANQEREINEFKQQERIRNLQIWLLIIGLILFSIIGFLVFQRQRSDIRKKQDLIAKNDEIHRLEKELIEKELEQKAFQQQKTEKELAYKTSRLTDFAIDIAQKNEFSNEVINRLDKIEKLKLSKKASDELRQFRIYVSSQLQINDSLSTFQQNVDAINLDFNQKLEQNFPGLSQKDLILCSLLRLNLQNKEIATLRNVSDNAIKMARYRLRKKLNLKAGDHIVDFLKNV